MGGEAGCTPNGRESFYSERTGVTGAEIRPLMYILKDLARVCVHVDICIGSFV